MNELKKSEKTIPHFVNFSENDQFKYFCPYIQVLCCNKLYAISCMQYVAQQKPNFQLSNFLRGSCRRDRKMVLKWCVTDGILLFMVKKSRKTKISNFFFSFFSTRNQYFSHISYEASRRTIKKT
jgi:hypothetical protein